LHFSPTQNDSAPLDETLILQIGQDLVGDMTSESTTVYRHNGGAVAVSGDGSTYAIGSVTETRIYEFDGQTLTKIGFDLPGVGDLTEENPNPLALSYDGTRVAIGIETLGVVKIFEKTGTQIGELQGSAGDSFGSDVSFNDDGSLLAVGIPGAGNTGSFQVYQYTAPSWSGLGPEVSGKTVSGKFGRSLQLSADGTRIIVGSPGNCGLNTPGTVTVFEYDSPNNKWNPITASPIGTPDAPTTQCSFGQSVSGNSDLTRVVVGYPYFDKSAGAAFIYEFENGGWTLKETMNAERGLDNSGWAVAMSADGRRVIVGAPLNDGSVNRSGAALSGNSGHVRVWEDQGDGDWIQVGPDTDGTYRVYSRYIQGSQLGRTVSISGNGSRFVVGEIWYSVAGSYGSQGRAKVFGIECYQPSWIQYD